VEKFGLAKQSTPTGQVLCVAAFSGEDQMQNKLDKEKHCRQHDL
jgi:hypothetical protein